MTGDVEIELEQSLQFHDGSCLDTRGQFNFPSMLWLLGEFLGVRAMNVSSLFGEKKMEKSVSEKIIKIFVFLQETHISSFHTYSE